MKKLILLSIIIFSVHAQSQTYVKVNALSTPLGVPNVGIETSIGKKLTFQFDILSSPWKSLGVTPTRFLTITPEVRYFFKEKNNGFYAGLNTGGTLYKFQKWTFLNTDRYESGFGYYFGATLGYQVKINNKFGLDCFLGGGWHQAFYHGYYLSSGERYDGATNWNISGDWLPYRGGVMVSYRLN